MKEIINEDFSYKQIEKESDMFLPLKDYFEGDNYEVYAEVKPYGGRRADIVVKQGRVIEIIEMKLQMNFEVIGQAQAWKHYANRIWIATLLPTTKKAKNEAHYIRSILKGLGIGWLKVSPINYRGDEQWEVNKEINPEYVRSITKIDWKDHLLDGYKNNIGGVNYQQLTPYKNMIKQVRDYMETTTNRQDLHFRFEDGKFGLFSLDVLAELVRFYYASPKNSIYQSLSKYETSWCEKVKVCGKAYFKLKDQAAVSE